MPRYARPGLTWKGLLRGLVTLRPRCPDCGSPDFRRARLRPAGLPRLLGLGVFRCSYCGYAFYARA